jgi:hypothetical protein
MPLTEISNEQDVAVFARPDAPAVGPVAISISHLTKIYPGLLDGALPTLQRNGGKIIAVDTERSSLLVVLESYERDDEGT